MPFPHDDTPTEIVLRDIDRERGRQDAQYGRLNATLGPAEWLAVLAREFCEAGNEANEAFKGRATSPAKLRAELVQLAAVAVAWVEAIDAAHEPKSTCTCLPGCLPADTCPIH